jgi:hypothetical protein
MIRSGRIATAPKRRRVRLQQLTQQDPMPSRSLALRLRGSAHLPSPRAEPNSGANLCRSGRAAPDPAGVTFGGECRLCGQCSVCSCSAGSSGATCKPPGGAHARDSEAPAPPVQARTPDGPSEVSARDPSGLLRG